MGEPQGRFGRVRKISPPLGFDPRTVHPVASRYTDRFHPNWCGESKIVIASAALISSVGGSEPNVPTDLKGRDSSVGTVTTLQVRSIPSRDKDSPPRHQSVHSG